MPWYAIHDKTTGELVSETSLASAIADPLPDHLVVKEFEGERPDFAANEWDPALKDAKPRPPKVPNPLETKDPAAWTEKDLAEAQQLVLKRLAAGA